MDVSGFKDLISKLSFIRNYSSLLLPAALTLVALLLFIPTQLISGKLKEQITDESISLGKEVQSQSRSAVPSSHQWEMERDYQQARERDASRIMLLARQSTQRQLLTYKIFPRPKDISALIFEEFGREFRNAVERLIAGINGRDCPTDAELERSLQSSSTHSPSWQGSLPMVSPRRLSNWSSATLSKVDAAIKDVICRQKAESASVYVNPFDLSGYEFWGNYEYAGMDEAVKDCWSTRPASSHPR